MEVAQHLCSTWLGVCSGVLLHHLGLSQGKHHMIKEHLMQTPQNIHHSPERYANPRIACAKPCMLRPALRLNSAATLRTYRRGYTRPGPTAVYRFIDPQTLM